MIPLSGPTPICNKASQDYEAWVEADGNWDTEPLYGMDLARNLERLLAEAVWALEKCADECDACNGTGINPLSVKTWPGGIEVDNEDQPCQYCSDLRAALSRLKAAGYEP